MASWCGTESPTSSAQRAKNPRSRVLDHEAYGDALFDKLVEEAEELRGADPDDRLEEIADVYEGLLAAIDLLDVTFEQVVETASMKQDEARRLRTASLARGRLSTDGPDEDAHELHPGRDPRSREHEHGHRSRGLDSSSPTSPSSYDGHRRTNPIAGQSRGSRHERAPSRGGSKQM